jgi:hypothetical protein
MVDIKISEATPVPSLEDSDMVPIARAGSDVPLNASLSTFANYITTLASHVTPTASADVAHVGTSDLYARADHVHPFPNPVVSPVLSGTPITPTPPFNDDSELIPNTSWVMRQLAAEPEYAPLDSPEFTGTPRVPTPGIDDNTEIIANTQYVQNQGSTVPPTMNGAANPGASRRWSREDHVHPVDTSRAPASAIPIAGDVTPAMNGTPATGISKSWSREDHVHPTDTSRAAVSAIPAASSTTPVMNGAGAVGTATTWARADHQHPTDTSRAPLASPAFTGNPTAPNPTPSTDADSSIATTYFVRTGITDGSEALAGQVGEYLSAQCLSSASIPLTSGIDTGITTLSLTPGDWDLSASIGFTMANNNSTTLKAWINTAGGTSAPPVDQVGGNVVMPIANNTPQVITPLVPTRVNLTATTIMRLGATITTSGGTISGWGKLMARRRR